MKKILTALGLCAALGVQAAIVWPRNVFTNPDFESGSLTGWDTTYAPSATVVTSAGSFNPYPDPLAPNAKFLQITAPSGTGTGSQSVSQTVNMSMGDTVQIWYGYQPGTRAGNATIEVYDVGDNLVGSATTTATSWQTYSFTAPSTGAFTFYLSAQKTVSHSGGAGFAVFDMSAVPEPRGWLMGGALLGMLGVGEFLRRRRAAQKAA
ncbi:MAG: hypothetical protein N3J91_06895 [Verrucomicrobiae bacterium]|nr:hypothetical protein [Verrucomicrobiae bacterium]